VVVHRILLRFCAHGNQEGFRAVAKKIRSAWPPEATESE
jgi:hypothetical protein